MFCLFDVLLPSAGIFAVLSLASAAHPEIAVHPRARISWNEANQKPQRIDCGARGSEPLQIYWYKDGRLVSGNQTSTERVWLLEPKKENGIFFCALNFAHIEKSDEGEYQCLARNSRGTARSRKAKVIVYGRPSVNHGKPLPKSISVAWGDTFSLQCQGSGPPVIQKVSWNYEVYSASNRRIFSGRQIKTLGATALRSLPREDDAMLKDVVRYKVYCTVYNAAGSQDSATTTINIKQAPGVPEIKEVTPSKFGRLATLYWKPGPNGFDKLKCQAELTAGMQVRALNLEMKGIDGEYQKFISSLIPMTTYTVRLRCWNSVGFSPWTPRLSFTTKEGFPDQAPRNLSVIVLNSTAVNMSWLPIPREHVFGTLEGYRTKILWGREKVHRKTVAANKTMVLFTELNPGTKYCGSVLGFTKVKDGELSRPKCVILPLYDKIKPPVITDIKTSQKAVTFMYVDNYNPSGTLGNCSILILDSELHEFRVPVSVSNKTVPAMIRNLLPNTRYQANIECSTVRGDHVQSTKQIFRTPEEKPQVTPQNLRLETEEKKLLVYWDDIDKVALNSFGNFTGYNICVFPATENSVSRCVLSFDSNYAFHNLEPGKTYTVTVAACTNAGCGQQAFKVVNVPSWGMSTKHSTTESIGPRNTSSADSGPVVVEGQFNFVYAAIGVLVVAIVIVALALYLQRRKRRKNTRHGNSMTVAYTPASNGSEQYTAVSPSPSNANTLNPYEVPLLSNRPLLSQETLTKLESVKFTRDCLELGERLGKGEFGRVYKGKFRPLQLTGNEDDDGNLEVAVKTMIMDEYDANEREEFVKEGLRMKDMDHPNVMRLIGICLPEESRGHTLTRVLSGFEAISPLVVVPYMGNGDLKNYLYKARIENDVKDISLHKLLRFAHDIVSGMEYLSSKNLVHRDLACRNCMLDSKMNVVVSDFGLSRQIYSSSYYRQKKTAKMPVKWMALESLVDRIYTSMTDVWSFGVTAWEIFTFCQNPYPGVQNHEMHELLKAGTRLKQPKRCPSDIWNESIYPCWDPRPDERPTFEELGEMFSEYLKVHPEYLDGESSNPVYVNVLPPDDYESLIEADKPLLRTNTISSENDEVPTPYESAVAKELIGKAKKKQSRERKSSKERLLKKSGDGPSTSNIGTQQLSDPMTKRERKDTLEEFVVEL